MDIGVFIAQLPRSMSAACNETSGHNIGGGSLVGSSQRQHLLSLLAEGRPELGTMLRVLHLEIYGNLLLVKRSVDVIWENCIRIYQDGVFHSDLAWFRYRLRSKPPFLIHVCCTTKIKPAVPQVHQQTRRWRIDHTPGHSMTGKGQDGKAFFLSKLGVEVGTANAILLSFH